MRNHSWLTFLFMLSLIQFAVSQPTFDLQGHRGCTGLMPENSIAGFLKAVELGVTTIEMDVVVSMDGQIVLSHEPWISPVICSHPDGKPVLKNEAKSLNIYRMKYSEVQLFDCGTRVHPDFPYQHKVKSVKPTLKMVVRSVERFAEENKYVAPRYAIELKSSPGEYEVYIPSPAVFGELVVKEIRRLGIEEKTTLQSFDIHVLEELHKIPDRKFQLGYVVRKGRKPEKNLAKLSFTPDIYVPFNTLVSPSSIQKIHERGMKIIPWTVNEIATLKKLVAWGVDGVITDYPDQINNK